MQPQQPDAPLPPDQYNFILSSDAKSKRRFSLPFPKLPRPLLIILGGGAAILVVLVLVAVIFGGRSGNSQPLVDLMARSQEIIRVSGLAEPKILDSGTKALVATTTSSLTSEQTQLSSYLAGSGSKVEPKNLTAYLDDAVDKQFEDAAKNNELDSTYVAYLKENLATYSIALKSAYKTAPAAAKPILETAYESVQAILSAPQF